MTQHLNAKDLEMLSAYMDGALKPKERVSIESRLKADAALRQALRDLKQNRALLRAAPQLRAPRNFTLSPALVGKPEHRWFPSFRMAFAVASMLFILVFAGGMLYPIGNPAPQMAAPAAEMLVAEPVEAPMMKEISGQAEESIDEVADLAEAVITEEIETSPSPAEDGVEMEKAAEETLSLAAEGVAEEGAAAAPLAGEGGSEEEAIATNDTVRALEVTEAATIEAPDPINSDDAGSSEGPDQGTPTPEPPVEPEWDEPVPVPVHVDEPVSPPVWLVALQWLLGLMALGTGITALYLYLRSR